MRRKLIAMGILLIFVLSLASFAGDQPEYVGAKKCKSCHKAEKNGKQFEIWSGKKHAKAYESLKAEGAAEKTKAASVKDPLTDEKCLSCHSTAYGAKNVAKSFVMEEGVSCEACHGPGSKYRKMKVMKDHDASVSAGLTVISDKLCLKCHGETAPGHKEVKFNFTEAKKSIAHPVPKETDRRIVK